MGWRRLVNNLWTMWLERGFYVGRSYAFRWTGVDGRMRFLRPVGNEFRISNPFGAWERWSNWHLANGLWIHGQLNGQGQHKGTDFACPEGTLVHAVCDGLVVAVGWENPKDPHQGFGLRVRQQIVTETGKVMTVVYGHLQWPYAKPGQQIVKGDRIGLSGNTGHTTGAHLHVELVDNVHQYHPMEFEDPEPPKIMASAPPPAAPPDTPPSDLPPSNT